MGIEQIIWITGTQISCTVTELFGAIVDEKIADRALLEFANAVKLRDLPRAKEYLAHFLNGSGTTKSFPLSELMKDSGVKRIVFEHFNSCSPKIHNNLITIGQSAFANPDWKFALGTYFIHYIDIGEHRNLQGQLTRHVLAWGEDTYQWHPDDQKRYTQCVHKAARRLEVGQGQHASTFRMHATDAIIDTSTATVNLRVPMQYYTASHGHKKHGKALTRRNHIGR